MKSCEDFWSEFHLHVEFTLFSVSGKQYNFIRVGSRSIKNAAVRQKEIWCARNYSVPKLRITTIVMIFSSGYFMSIDSEVG
jgi:hypothetical protein